MTATQNPYPDGHEARRILINRLAEIAHELDRLGEQYRRVGGSHASMIAEQIAADATALRRLAVDYLKERARFSIELGALIADAGDTYLQTIADAVDDGWRVARVESL